MEDNLLEGLPQSPPVRIRGLGVALRGDQVAVSELPGIDRLHPDIARSFDGCTIRDAAAVDGFDLSLDAAERALADAGITGSELDFIVHVASRVPRAFVASEVGHLQRELGARQAIGLSLAGLGCADTSMAVKLAADHLAANPGARNALVTYGHVQYAASRFRQPVTVNGDGGGAIVLGRDARATATVLAVEQALNGDYWDLFSVEHVDAVGADYAEICQSERRYGFELAVESKNRFEALDKRMIDRTGHGLRTVDHVVMQNISLQAYEFYELAFAIRVAPVCAENLRRYGHLGGADIFLNLKSGIDRGLFRQDQTVLVLNNSPAAAWSMMLVRI